MILAIRSRDFDQNVTCAALSCLAVLYKSRHMGPITAITREIRAGLSALGLAVTMLAAVPAFAESNSATVAATTESTLPIELGRAGWRLLMAPSKALAQFTSRGAGTIGVSAANAVAFPYRPVTADMDPKRRLSWRWRVDEAVLDTDLSRAGKDDRSLAIHLVFPVNRKKLSFWERIRLGLTRVFAPPLAGQALTYAWGGTLARRTILSNPHLYRHGNIIVLRNGAPPTGQWLTEDIDFLSDFRSAFGYSPPAPVFLAISADSDDTGGHSRGAIADLLVAD